MNYFIFYEIHLSKDSPYMNLLLEDSSYMEY